jgi:hypothetical protein
LTEKPIARAAGSRTAILQKRCWPCWPARRLSLAAIAWSWRNGALLNYGDAVAHLHIARRVFDSHQPRLTQLGSVWLPLPHMLLLPFVQVYAGGPMDCRRDSFGAGLPGRLRGHLPAGAALAATRAAALALAFFALNPNLLYLQTTAMTEPLFLCEMIWIAVWLVEWRAASTRSAQRSPALQGWIASRWWPPSSRATTAGSWRCSPGRRSASRCSGAAAALARFWLASAWWSPRRHRLVRLQRAAFGDWLDFLRGPTPPRPSRCAPPRRDGRRIPAGTIPGSRCSSS